MKFGYVLKELLSMHDLTQKQLAAALNLSPSALGNYIQDSREPDYETLIQIADYFQVTTDFLLNHPGELPISQKEKKLLYTFRCLTEDQQEFYIEQGQIFIRQNKKKGLSLSPASSDS